MRVFAKITGSCLCPSKALESSFPQPKAQYEFSEGPLPPSPNSFAA
jgi:hypothetical protein